MNNMNKRTFLSLLLCVCCLSFLHAERVDMQQAGADVQGRKLNTALINSTIDRPVSYTHLTLPTNSLV